MNMNLERGIFKSLAVPLYDGEHQRVCLRVMVGARDAPPTRTRRLRRRLQVEVHGDLPPLLEMHGVEAGVGATAKV